MVTRFYLDQSQLDDANVGLGGPSPAFVLDTSTLDGNGVLDGTTFTTTATGASSLGWLTASATGTVTPVVSGVATAQLGELIAEVSGVEITVDADASAALGGLTASAVGAVTIVASASGSLGAATSSATAVVTHPASGEALLGGLTALATGTVIPLGTMTAQLGEMTASAIGTVTPQPQPDAGGGGEPYRYPRPKKKKIQEVVIVEDIVVEVEPNVVEAYLAPIFVGSSASAVGSITFSAEDDDLQVMLML